MTDDRMDDYQSISVDSDAISDHHVSGPLGDFDAIKGKSSDIDACIGLIYQFICSTEATLDDEL